MTLWQAKNFKVVVRVRPPIAREGLLLVVLLAGTVSNVAVAAGENEVVNVETAQVVSIVNPDESSSKTHTFVFDRVYDSTVRQMPLYESCVKVGAGCELESLS